MKTKIISDLKILGLVAIGIVIGASSIIIYAKGTEMYRFVIEIQTWEDSYFQSKSNEATRKQTVTLHRGLPSTVETSGEKVAPEGASATPSPTSNRDLVAEMGAKHWGESEAVALLELVDRESDFNHTAQNPVSTAYGMFQFLDSTWKAYGCEKTSDPVKQTECGLKYISKRYGSPSKALAYHNQTNSY